MHSFITVVWDPWDEISFSELCSTRPLTQTILIDLKGNRRLRILSRLACFDKSVHRMWHRRYENKMIQSEKMHLASCKRITQKQLYNDLTFSSKLISTVRSFSHFNPPLYQDLFTSLPLERQSFERSKRMRKWKYIVNFPIVNSTKVVF